MDSATTLSEANNTGRTPGTPSTENFIFPEVMTEEEVIRYLRLDLVQIDDPSGTLTYYRRRGLLRGTQIGKCIRYRRIELERFLERLTEENPR